MIKIPKFLLGDPKDEDELLITDLIDKLHVATSSFIHDNFKGQVTQREFLILRDGCVNFSALMVRNLLHILYPTQHTEFKMECTNIFNSCINQELTDKDKQHIDVIKQ